MEMKKLLFAVMLMFGLSMVVASCGGGNSRSNENSSSRSEQSEEDPYDLYSDWSECIDIRIEPGSAIGQDVIIKNICKHTINTAVVTVYCDGRSQDLNYYNVKPGAIERKTVSVMSDADLEVIDIQIIF